MMSLQGIVKLSGGAALLLFLGLAVLSKGWLEPAGDLIFDSRIFGYNEPQAQAYLAVITERQRGLYLDLFRWMDTLLPVLLALCLAGVIWLRSVALRPMLRLLLLAPPLVYLALDLAENALVADMLRQGTAVADETVRRASVFTMSKWGGLAFTAVICILLWWREKGNKA